MRTLRELISSIQTRATPCTWGQLQTWLTTELARIKQEGQIMINPPEVILPDGITTTSLVSQSEMTQFVTNTLNTWLAASPIARGYNIKGMCYPELRKGTYDTELGYVGDGGAYTVKYYSNYDNIIQRFLNPEDNKTHDVTYYDHASGKITADVGGALSGYASPLQLVYPSSGGYMLSIRPLTVSLEDDFTNIEQIWQRDYMSIINAGPCPSVDILKVANPFTITWDRIASDQIRDVTKCLISLESKLKYTAGNDLDSDMIPLVEISQEDPWYSSGSTYYVTIPLYARYDKANVTQ